MGSGYFSLLSSYHLKYRKKVGETIEFMQVYKNLKNFQLPWFT